MAFSFVTLTGDGTTDTFSFSFPYIARSHIKVTVGGVEDTGFTFVNDTTIQPSETPSDGAQVIISRNTPQDPLIDFADGATLVESDMDTMLNQSIYLTQEARDQVVNTISLSNGQWDAQESQFINLPDPTGDGQAATKGYADTVKNETISARDAAQLAESNAQAHASDALTYRDESRTARDDAEAAANSIPTYEEQVVPIGGNFAGDEVAHFVRMGNLVTMHLVNPSNFNGRLDYTSSLSQADSTTGVIPSSMMPGRTDGLWKTHTNVDITLNTTLSLSGLGGFRVKHNDLVDGSDAPRSNTDTQLSMTWTLSQNF